MDPIDTLLIGFVIPAICVIALIGFLYPVIQLGFALMDHQLDNSIGSMMLFSVAFCSVAFLELSLFRLLCIAVFIPIWNRIF